MIGRILICDNCNAVDGALPAFSGSDARTAKRRGGIRRVVLGTYILKSGFIPARTETLRMDLCSSCRQPHQIAAIQTTWAKYRVDWLIFTPVSK